MEETFIALRSRRAAPLHDDILEPPSMIVIKALLNLRNDLTTLAIYSRNRLSQDARIIIDKCIYLQERLQRPPSYAELEGYSRYLYNLLTDCYSKEIVQCLSYDTRLKLSLIVWHFGGLSDEPSLELWEFLQSPTDEVLETIHVRYEEKIGQKVLYNHYSFDFLLSSQLLQKHPDSQLESGDSQYQPRPPRSLVKCRSVPTLRQGRHPSSQHRPLPYRIASLRNQAKVESGQSHPLRFHIEASKSLTRRSSVPYCLDPRRLHDQLNMGTISQQASSGNDSLGSLRLGSVHLGKSRESCVIGLSRQ